MLMTDLISWFNAALKVFFKIMVAEMATEQKESAPQL